MFGVTDLNWGLISWFLDILKGQNDLYQVVHVFLSSLVKGYCELSWPTPTDLLKSEVVLSIQDLLFSKWDFMQFSDKSQRPVYEKYVTEVKIYHTTF